MTPTWFVYCPSGGLSLHDSEREAIREAEEALEYLTSGSVHPDAGVLCWGRVHGHAERTRWAAITPGRFDLEETWEIKAVTS